jgi:hypothetical protein
MCWIDFNTVSDHFILTNWQFSTDSKCDEIIGKNGREIKREFLTICAAAIK